MAGRDQQIPTNRRLHVLHVSVPTSGGVATVATSYVRDQVERGWNVTVPHKEAVLTHLDELSPAARAIGAVNTIVHRDGRLLGANTDVDASGSGVNEPCGHGDLVADDHGSAESDR